MLLLTDIPFFREIIKARMVKYYKRTPTGQAKRKWRYYYTRADYEREHGHLTHEQSEAAGHEKGQVYHEEHPAPALEIGIKIEPYSDRAIALSGDTKKYLDVIQGLKRDLNAGFWHAKKKLWLFPSVFQGQIEDRLRQNVEQKVSEQPRETPMIATLPSQQQPPASNQRAPGRPVSVKDSIASAIASLDGPDKKYLQAVQENFAKLPNALTGAVSKALLSMDQVDPAFVLKMVRNYISESALQHYSKNPSTVQPENSVQKRVVITKLRALADSMQEKIDYGMNPAIANQNATARRARIAAGMGEDAERLKKVQAAIRGLADAMDRGDDLPDALSNIKSKSEIESILTEYRLSTHDQYPRPFKGGYISLDRVRYDSDAPIGEYNVSRGNRVYGMSSATAKKLGLISEDEYKAYKKFEKRRKQTPDKEYHSIDLDELQEYIAAIRVGDIIDGQRVEKTSKGFRIIGTPAGHYNLPTSAIRMIKLGITSDEKLRAAGKILSELMSGKYQAMDGSNKKIKDLERDLIGRKIPGFFPTPAPIVNEMIQRADIKPGMKVLEPSAGKGDIADAIRAAGVDPDVVEPYSSLRDILKEKGHSIVGDDFLEFGQEKRDGTYGDTFAAPDGTVGYLRGSGGMGSDRVKLVDENGQQLGLYSKSDLTLKQKNGEYDRIVMNPPFEKGADIDHVRLAYDLLKPGGKLVAVMGEGPFFRSDNKSRQFRDWLATVGTSEALPQNSFKGKDSFRQTGVNTRLVEIEKPGRSLSEAMIGNQNAAGPHESTGRKVIDPMKVAHYNPNEAAARLGKKWALKDINGKEWPVLFNTRKEAVAQGERHRNLMEEMVKDPAAFGRTTDSQSISKKPPVVPAMPGMSPLGISQKEPKTKAQAIHSPQFKSWFGDWQNHPENASKVVNPKGEPQEQYNTTPIAVYHGTAVGGFSEFKKPENGGGIYGPGMYFTEDKSIAEEYTSKDKEQSAAYAHGIIVDGKPTDYFPEKIIDQYLGGVSTGKVINAGFGIGDNPNWSLNIPGALQYAHEPGKGYNAQKFLHAYRSFGVSPDYFLSSAEISRIIASGEKIKMSEEFPTKTTSTSMQGLVNFFKDMQRKGISPAVSKAEVFEVYLNIRNPLDMDKVASAAEVNSFMAKHKKSLYMDDLLSHDDWDALGFDYGGSANQYDYSKILKIKQRMYDKTHDEDVSVLGSSMKKGDPVFPLMHRSKRDELTWADVQYIVTNAQHRSDAEAFMESLKSNGHDGIKHTGGWNIGTKEHTVWIAFEPNQIKATKNSGSFDPASNDIFKSARKRSGFLLSQIPGFQRILKSEKLVGGEGNGRPDSEFNPEDLEAAVQHEMREHGHDRQIATELAKDHLTEDPDYYRKQRFLARMMRGQVK